MLKKIFGKKKSIQRSLIISMFVTVLVVFISSMIGFYLFVDIQAAEKLIQINIENEEQVIKWLEICKNIKKVQMKHHQNITLNL